MPFLVVGTGGSVSTGAVDPLPEIAALCREHGIWFHVDGAYGGFAAAVPEAPDALRGLRLADSVAVDPHKWLYAPLEAGCALVRDRSALRAAFAYHPPYYHFAEQATNYRGLRPAELARVPRAQGVAGAAPGGRGRLPPDDRRRHPAVAASGRRGRASMPSSSSLTQDLSITTFRYVPGDLRARAGRSRGRAPPRCAERGAARSPSSAAARRSCRTRSIRGRYALRACIVNFHTDAPTSTPFRRSSSRTGGGWTTSAGRQRCADARS